MRRGEDREYKKKANELFEEMRQKDPFNRNVRDEYVMNIAFLGDLKGAIEQYERGRALFGDHWSDGTVSLLRLSAGDIVSRDGIVYSSPIHDAAKEHLDSPEQGLAAIRRFYANGDNLSSSEFCDIAIWAAYFGDPLLALDAMEKSMKINASGLFHIWWPFMKEVRRTPRFKEFVREIGLVDYWNKFGWPDLCRPLDNVDFECD